MEKKEFQKNEISWNEFVTIQTAKNEKALNEDFGISNYYQPQTGEIVNLKEFVALKTDTGVTFPAFKCYNSNNFVGYLSFNALRGRKYIGIKTSKRTGNKYAATEELNLFGAKKGTTFCIANLKKALEGKNIICKEVNKQEIPAFGADLTEDKIDMVLSNYYIFDFSESKAENKGKKSK